MILENLTVSWLIRSVNCLYTAFVRSDCAMLCQSARTTEPWAVAVL